MGIEAVVTTYDVDRRGSCDWEVVEITDTSAPPLAGLKVLIEFPHEKDFQPTGSVDQRCVEACRSAVQLLERYLAQQG